MLLRFADPNRERGPEESHGDDEVVRPGVADDVEHQVQLIIAGEFDPLLLYDRFHNERHPILQRDDLAKCENEVQKATDDGDECWCLHFVCLKEIPRMCRQACRSSSRGCLLNRTS